MLKWLKMIKIWTPPTAFAHCIEFVEHFLLCYVIFSSQIAPDFWLESTTEYRRFEWFHIEYKSYLSNWQIISCHRLPTNSQFEFENIFWLISIIFGSFCTHCFGKFCKHWARPGQTKLHNNRVKEAAITKNKKIFEKNVKQIANGSPVARKTISENMSTKPRAGHFAILKLRSNKLCSKIAWMEFRVKNRFNFGVHSPLLWLT